MSKGVVCKESALEIIEDEFGWVVAVAIDLLKDNATLLVNLMLGKSTVENDVDKVKKSLKDRCIQDLMLTP